MSKANLAKHAQYVVSSWYNRFHPERAGGVPDALDWLDWRLVLTDVLQRDNIRTRRQHLCTLCAVLGEMGLTEEKAEVYEKFKDVDAAVRKLEENQQAPKDWIPLKEIVRVRDSLATPPLGRLSPNQARKRHFQWLALCLYTKMPPLRCEWGTMQIMAYTPGDKTRNFLVYGPSGGFTVLLNVDKVSGHYGAITLKVPDDLAADIRASLQLYPREYVATNSANRPYTGATWSTFVNDIVPGKRVGIRILRSAYITDFYERHKSIKARKELALQMRHTRDRAETSYYKPAQTTPEQDAAARKARGTALQAVRRLNGGLVAKPGARVITEHALYQDQTGRWHSRKA